MTEIGVDFQVDEFKTVILGLRIVQCGQTCSYGLIDSQEVTDFQLSTRKLSCAEQVGAHNEHQKQSRDLGRTQ